MRRLSVLVVLVLLIGVGLVPAASATYSRTYSSGPVNLAFGSMQASINSVITVPSHGTITDVNVSVAINHTYVGDIILTVIGDTGTNATLLHGNCSGYDDVNATFDDEGSALVCSSTPPAISGSVVPENGATYHHLSVFDGEDMFGTWTLIATDNYPASENGLLVEWSLTFELSGDEPPPAAFGKVSPPMNQEQEPLQPTLTWEASDGASYYEYCIEPDGDGYCHSDWVYVGTSTSATPSLDDGTGYLWQVRAWNASGFTVADDDWWWGFWTYVTNDEPSTPWVIGALPYSRTQLTREATHNDADPLLSCLGAGNHPGTHSVWYSFTATDRFALVLDTFGSNYDTALAVYTGEPSDLHEIACNDDYVVLQNYQSKVTLMTAPGVTYLIEAVAYTPQSSASTSLTLHAAAGETHAVTFQSEAAYDGWVLESAEDAEKGNAYDAGSTLLALGDDSMDRQYRAILDFDTSSLPDDAVVVGVTLRLKRQGITGKNPILTHGLLKVDMRTGFFHDIQALEKYDFQAPGSRGNVGRFVKVMSPDGWYRAPLRSPSYALVNRQGTTQFRLRFELGDNDNVRADVLSVFSGDAGEENRPQLVVEYYVP